MRQITTASLSNQNITTRLNIATYTADADRALYVRVFADQIAGNGTYVCDITIQRLGSGSAYQVEPTTSVTVASGTTAAAFTSVMIPVKSTDVVKVYLTGLAGDTTTPDTVVEWWEDELFITVGAAGAGLTAVGDTAGTTTLLSRLTSTRAGYLDNLSAGAVATAAKLLSYFQSALRKDVTVDTDIGGNYDDATDSQEAIRDRGDSAWGASGVATTVWEHATRTLTQGAASVVAAVTGTSITAYRGTRWSITLTGLTTFSDTTYTALVFSVKRNTDDADSEAICQVRKNRTGGGDGLTAFEGAPTVTAGQASITVNSATSITIVVEGATTQYATPDDYVYGIKVLDASGYPTMLSSGGKFTVSADVPLAVS